LATRPGWLEWTWAALRPVFANGHAQTAAWRAAEGLHIPGLPDISRHALRVWGVTADGEATIRAACTSFVRVSPVSPMLSGRPPRDGRAGAGAPPAPRAGGGSHPARPRRRGLPRGEDRARSLPTWRRPPPG